MNILSNTEGKKLLFHTYRPSDLIVRKNKNMINGVLNPDFCLNGWIKNFNIEKGGINFKNISIINKNDSNIYAFIEYKKIKNLYIIYKLYNKTSVSGLGVILLNMLKKELKEGECLILKNDVARYRKSGKRNENYYKKQGFEEIFFNNSYYSKFNINIFLKYKLKILLYLNYI